MGVKVTWYKGHEGLSSGRYTIGWLGTSQSLKGEKVFCRCCCLRIMRVVGAASIFHDKLFTSFGRILSSFSASLSREERTDNTEIKNKATTSTFPDLYFQETVLTRQQLLAENNRFDTIIFHYIQHDQPARTLYNNHGYQIHHIQCHWWLYWIVTHIFVDIF